MIDRCCHKSSIGGHRRSGYSYGTLTTSRGGLFGVGAHVEGRNEMSGMRPWETKLGPRSISFLGNRFSFQLSERGLRENCLLFLLPTFRDDDWAAHDGPGRTTSVGYLRTLSQGITSCGTHTSTPSWRPCVQEAPMFAETSLRSDLAQIIIITPTFVSHIVVICHPERR